MVPASSPVDNGQFPPLKRGTPTTLQVNLGYRCNQSCRHCHVGAGPNRTEEMTAATADSVIAYLSDPGTADIDTLDLTGGAPELNPHFRRLVVQARNLGLRVMDRCNLTVLEAPGQSGLAEFLASQHVEVVASLPCYLEENVNSQRGEGVFATSIRALTRLNTLGYGREDSGETALPLSLVYNPTGPYLPPPQHVLEASYKQALAERHGVVFTRLLTMTNLPIRRFAQDLRARGELAAYRQLLKEHFRYRNLDNVMCRTLISVDWRGWIYDCDFSQMLDVPMGNPLTPEIEETSDRAPLHIGELSGLDLRGNPIAVAGHCFGCTAGQGSGCGGALDA